MSVAINAENHVTAPYVERFAMPRCGRSGRPKKVPSVKEIAALRLMGYSWTMVARRLGVHRNTIVRRRAEDKEFREATNIVRIGSRRRISEEQAHILADNANMKRPVLLLIPLTKQEYAVIREAVALQGDDMAVWARRRLKLACEPKVGRRLDGRT